ncbi:MULTISPECIES: queuosine precursor transporter [unclassified Ruminococcus]|uniref:queuosine precursor transporter n=1 Tax=unclassified Ruminococcus TaxID=2608920 RepID=UPI00210B7AD0|nr:MULTISPECIES: queuosine precursor transporter [unclassified Ruminococcus]MCQ4115178.1 queuosine precursor transporter [Ruminococcus sp. zg-921]
MMNSILFILAVVFYLFAVIVAYKLFGKTGLYVFTAISAILANIQVCKNVDIFGLSTTAGNVLYAASFLVTDILSEKYGKKAAQKAVYIGIFTTLIFLIGTQGLLSFTPNSSDIMNEPLTQLFGFVPRIAIGSLLGYILSQSIDVALYHLIWKKTGNNKKMLWLRNCGSTLTSQAVDTVVFTTVAFYGVYDNSVFISILLTTYLFKAIVAFCDTPFVYLARKLKIKEEK